jgi:thiamine-phosphate pyrophosphorylase
MKRTLPKQCLMLVTDRKQCHKPLEEVVAQAVKGGADVIQLREKDLPPIELLRLAAVIRKVIGRSSILIINGDARVARDSGADGVHLPEDGLSIADAREILGKDALVGKSVHSTPDAVLARASGADYLVLGTIYASSSKPNVTPAGTELLAQISGLIRIPVLAIGGVTAPRVPQILQTGAAGIAVCSSILASRNCLFATRALRSALDAGPQPQSLIKISVNGEKQELNGESSVQDFLLRSQPRGCLGMAVALNGEILLRDQYPRKKLKEGDSLELVQMTAGG